ncbi:hypothetical protein PHMEG_00035250, partial [Phytophthora megakarya]
MTPFRSRNRRRSFDEPSTRFGCTSSVWTGCPRVQPSGRVSESLRRTPSASLGANRLWTSVSATRGVRVV